MIERGILRAWHGAIKHIATPTDLNWLPCHTDAATALYLAMLLVLVAVIYVADDFG